jgi:hypothetical protein
VSEDVATLIGAAQKIRLAVSEARKTAMPVIQKAVTAAVEKLTA